MRLGKMFVLRRYLRGAEYGLIKRNIELTYVMHKKDLKI